MYIFRSSSVIFPDLRSLKLLAHFDINIHHLDERRNTVLHQAVLGKKPGGGNLEICTEKSCWCYVFMIVLVRFVTSNDLWNLWTSMDFSGLLWTSIGFMFSYVFICFHMFSYVFIACAWLARLIFIGSRLIQIQQVLMQFCCRVPVGRCKCFYQ